MSLWNAYLEDIIFSFRKHKELAEKAFRQVGDEEFFKKPGEHSNSIAIITTHVAGNTGYHVGQVVYLARLLTTEGWNWITIPPGQSKQWSGKYLKPGKP
jgi:hypothetical protein